MKQRYYVYNRITGEKFSLIEIIKDFVERGKLFRIPLLLKNQFFDIEIREERENGTI